MTFFKKEKIAVVFAGMFVPAAAFYFMECYTHNPFEQVRSWAQVFNIALFELTAWIFAFLLGNVKWALRLELIFAMVYGTANAYVVRFRTNPIVPWDIFSWKTAASVASNYDFTPDKRMIAVWTAFVVLLFFLRFVPAGFEHIKWRGRVFGAALLCAVLCLFAKQLQNEEFQTAHRLYPFLFTPAYMTQVNGIAVTFTMNLAYMAMEKPAGYDAQHQQAVLETFVLDNSKQSEELPNIIVVMNEAFSDLSVLGDFFASEDMMPYVHRLQQDETTVTGYLNVSVCGGNTANTEFEFLTGNSMAFLPQGSIPYQQYITHEIFALPSYLASLGYETAALHPYYASGWDRERVYPLLGFSKTFFQEEFTNPRYIRKYVSDNSCVNQIIELYENKEEGTPLFLFAVTMQNHGGYTETFENFTPDITVEGSDSTALSCYLSLIKRSDKALEKLISYFEHADEKTVIVFFGDHQPNDSVAEQILNLNGMSTKSLTEEQLKLRYQVPYVIWSNDKTLAAEKKDTSANYLAAQMLSYAGIDTTGYFSYLLEVQNEYPIVSAMRAVTKDGADTNPHNLKEELLDYQSMQYYQLFDQK